jgi:sugar phosphate isomerase/epimerase
VEIGAVTDEFSPADLSRALGAMSDLGMTFAELRVLFGRNVIDLTGEEIDRVRQMVESAGMRVLSIASPLLKCGLPDAPPLAPHLQQDLFGSAYTFEDQPRLTRRAFEIAERTGASVIRVFSYWRTVDPTACFDRVAAALGALAEEAGRRGLVIGLENEHACNVATATETAHLMNAVNHPALQIIWDPANCYVSGENPFPEGYARLPVPRIVHVHAKDCRVADHAPVFGPLGEMGIDWRGQIAALLRDGYRGGISLETHWPGPGGDKFQGSMICGRNLQHLVRASGSGRTVGGP